MAWKPNLPDLNARHCGELFQFTTVVNDCSWQKNCCSKYRNTDSISSSNLWILFENWKEKREAAYTCKAVKRFCFVVTTLKKLTEIQFILSFPPIAANCLSESGISNLYCFTGICKKSSKSKTICSETDGAQCSLISLYLNRSHQVNDSHFVYLHSYSVTGKHMTWLYFRCIQINHRWAYFIFC